MFRPVGVLLVACMCCLVTPAQVRKAARVTSYAAESIRADIPVLGFAPSVSGTQLRPIWGDATSPGLGPALSLVRGVMGVVLAPSQTTAIISSASGWHVFSLRSQTLRPISSEITDTEGGFGAISDSGSAGIVVSPRTQTATVFRGLPEKPEQTFSADLSRLSAPVVAAAVNDEGDLAILATSDGQHGMICMLRSGEPVLELGSSGYVSAIRWTPDGKSVVVADRVWNNVRRVDVGKAPSVHLVADGASGVDEPVDIAVDARNSRIFIANHSGRTITDLSVDGCAFRSIPTPFPVTRMTYIRTAALLVLSSGDAASLWTVHSDPTPPVVRFLPSID